MIYTALIGYPTQHSVSPQLFSCFARQYILDYAHIKIDLPPWEQSLEETVKSLRKLHFSGFNVTIPYKQEIIPFLDEVDEFASKIGAVNTVYRRENRLLACNTDAYGAKKSIENSLQRAVETKDKLLIFGSGGACKAIIGGLMEHCGEINVIYRSPQSVRTQDLQQRFGSRIQLHSLYSNKLNTLLKNSSIICNATPLGSIHQKGQNIIPLAIPPAGTSPKVFFDVVYKPLETAFLQEAKAAGHLIANGLEMMIYQGVKAFELWTGTSPDDISIQLARKQLEQLV